jgi:hypothetical protein
MREIERERGKESMQRGIEEGIERCAGGEAGI